MSSWIRTYRPQRRFHPSFEIPVVSSTSIPIITPEKLISEPEPEPEPEPILATVPVVEKGTPIYLDDFKYRLERFNSLNKVITFIVPTIGRNTLSNAIHSLFNQNTDIWKAVIVFDGINDIDLSIKELLNDDRILYISVTKTGIVDTGTHGAAGAVRNIGMEYINTPWIGFLDDDDTLTSNYCEKLLQEVRITPKADIISFKMYDNDKIIPPLNYNKITSGMIGISFCFKAELLNEGFKFKQSGLEDFTLLRDFEDAHKKIVLSPFICYCVRNSKQFKVKSTKRYVIN
jgi:glycosyltransferase involved in cell wall biosynthesis